MIYRMEFDNNKYFMNPVDTTIKKCIKIIIVELPSLFSEIFLFTIIYILHNILKETVLAFSPLSCINSEVKY